MKTRTIGVPKVLHRSGTSEMSGDGKVMLSIATDTPYLRYDWRADEDYYEVLDHSPGSINMTRLRAGAALLFNHNRDIQLGTIDQPQVINGKLFVDSKVSEAPDIESYRIRIKEKILKDTSVGYEVDEEGEYDGDKDGIPVYRFKWFPHEASFVTIAADINCGLGRDTADREERDGKKPELKEIQIAGKIPVDDALKNENNSQEREKRKSKMTPEETAALEAKERKQRERDEADAARERNEKIQDGIRIARERESEINAIAKRASVPSEKKGEFERTMQSAIEKSVLDEKAVSDFQTYVFKNFFGSAKPLDTPSGEGSGDIRVAGDGTSKTRSIGEAFVKSKEVTAAGGRIARGACVGVDFPNISMIGIKGKIAMAQRAGFTSSDLSAVNITTSSEILALGVQRLTIMDVIASGTIATGVYKYARENGFGTINGVAVAAGGGGAPGMPRAQTVGERGVKPNWDADLSTETANVCKVAITTKVPDEFLADFPSAMSYIDQRLPFMVDTETEFQILYGDGLNNNLKGIFTTAGVQTRAITTTDDSTKAASIRQGLTDIQVGAQFEPDFIGFHPYDWETACLLKDTTGRFLAGGPYYIPFTTGVYQEVYTFWGKRVVVSTAITYGKPIAGAGKLGAQALIREEMRIEMTNANEDDFKRNLICLRAEHRLALPVYRPVAFLEFTGWPARA